MFRRLIVLVPVLALAVSVFAYPSVDTNPNNVQPNRWTSQLGAARARAGQLGLPMLVMCIDTVTCGNCGNWDSWVLKNAAWPAFLAQYPMMLVMLDRSSLSSTSWNTLTQPYRGAGGSLTFPTAAVHAPSGQKLGQFNYGMGNGYFRTPGFMNKILSYTLPYYGPGTIGLSPAAQSVAEDAGEVTVTVTRTDGSAGAQSFSYATVDDTAKAGTDYTATSGTLTWGDKDTSAKSFTVPLINNGRWTAPTQRVFTVTIARVAGDAELGTAEQTVTIYEAEPYLPGTIGFSADFAQVPEGSVYTGTVSRTGGAVGAAGVTVTAPEGYTVTPRLLEWGDGDSADKLFTVSGIDTTPQYDARTFTLELALDSGQVALGTDAQTVQVLDQLVSATFETYVAGRPVYEHLAQAGGLWFYNDAIDALRTEPLNNSERAVLVWTAPAAGRLAFTWGQTGTGTLLVEVVDVDGSLTLTESETNNTVAVYAGDEVRWTATGHSDEYVAYVTDLGWEPLVAPTAAAGLAPTDGRLLQIDDVRADVSLVDLAWQAGAENPADAVQCLFAGAAADALVEVVPAGGVVVSGLNAVDEGIVDLTEAQGWVYWRVDTQVTADLGTVSVQGPAWRFAVVDVPMFQAGTPGEGQVWTTYLKAGVSLPLAADSTTPVTYTATGLPAGMMIDQRTGTISGTPKRSGVYAVTVRATNQAGSKDLRFVISVQPLPDFVRGVKMQGLLLEPTETPSTEQAYEGVVVGTVTFQASSSGKLRARTEVGGKRQSLTGTWVVDGLDANRLTGVLDNRAGDTMELVLTADGILRGVYNNGMLVLARAFDPADAPVYQGFYTVALPTHVLATASAAIDNRPEGYGYLTLTVRRNGQVKYAGQLADGQRLNGTSALMAFSGAEMRAMGYDVVGNGSFAVFPLYKTLYGRRGHAAAMVWIEPHEQMNVADNLVWIENTRWHYPGKSTSMKNDGFLAVFEWDPKPVAPVFGQAHICGAFFAKQQDFTAPYDGAQFHVADQALPVTVTKKALSLERRNDLSATLKTSSSSGLLSGSFKQETPGARRASTLKFKGILVNLQGLGLGFGAYQEPDPETGAYRLNRSKAVSID